MSGAPRPSETAALQAELLSRLGLPAGASPEQIDDVHFAVSQYLSAAPASLRPWAHAQAAALDEAYLLLTDPAGLQGSALRSPTRPPMVVPGGPATPPARRGPSAASVAAGSVAAGAHVTAADAPEAAAEEAVDFESLYASVTPSAHSEMGPEVLTAAERNRRKRAAQAAARTAAVEQAGAGRGPAAMGGNTWKRLTFALVAVIAVIAVAFIVGNTVLKPGGSGSVAAVSPSPSGPVLDAVRVQALMAQLQANPKDEATLTALGDEYFKAEQFATAATWYDKALVEAPKNVALLLARGASAYNAGDDATAKKFWEQAVAIDPKNQEAYYDLGFMYMNSNPPDWTGVQTAWSKVIAIDPSTQLAQVVQQHLDSLASASMIPGASGSASGSPSPSGSPAASTSGSVVNQTALNQTYGSATLTAPANQAFTIHFDNQEAGVPHDIQIADPAGNVFFKGETVTGPKAIDYAVKALPAGSYPFHCSIHSTMTGTLVVGG